VDFGVTRVWILDFGFFWFGSYILLPTPSSWQFHTILVLLHQIHKWNFNAEHIIHIYYNPIFIFTQRDVLYRFEARGSFPRLFRENVLLKMTTVRILNLVKRRSENELQWQKRIEKGYRLQQANFAWSAYNRMQRTNPALPPREGPRAWNSPIFCRGVLGPEKSNEKHRKGLGPTNDSATASCFCR